jgi:hypothetical protein
LVQVQAAALYGEQTVILNRGMLRAASAFDSSGEVTIITKKADSLSVQNRPPKLYNDVVPTVMTLFVEITKAGTDRKFASGAYDEKILHSDSDGSSSRWNSALLFVDFSTR